MAGLTVAEFIEAMPGDDAAEIAPAVERLFALEDQINGEIVGVACARFVPSGSGQLVVTNERLILSGNDGWLAAIDFSEIVTMVIGLGAQRVFGGYDPSYLMVHRRQGGTVTLSLAGDRNWAMGTMAAAQRAHQQYCLNSPQTRVPPVSAAAPHRDLLSGTESVTLSPEQVRELDLLLTTLSVYAEARSNNDIVRRVNAFTATALRRGV